MRRHVLYLLFIILLFNISPVNAESANKKPSFLESIGGFFDSAWTSASDTASEAFNTAGERIGEVANAVGEEISETASIAGDKIGETVNVVGEKIGEAANIAGETIGVAWNDAGQVVVGVWNSVIGAATSNSSEEEHDIGIVAEPILEPGTLKMYLGSSAHNTGTDNGYSENNDISIDDPHFGWSIGGFYVAGYTSVTSDSERNPVFLKNVGDNVELHFELYRDIKALGGNPSMSICEDVNGYDKYFGVPRTNFARGCLITRHTDYQNRAGEPQVYTDYLASKAKNTANTTIALNEEGDYEVALNYEIENASSIVHGYTNYRIFTKFSVRNGNCMIYPFDVATRAELMNSAITENGFYLDLAVSRYLDINIKRSVLIDGVTGLTEDQRFNRPAKDGEEYTQEGIYTICVTNRYTGEHTEKQIFVGGAELLEEYLNNGLSLSRNN